MQSSFSRWHLWQPSCISDRTILAIFDLQVTSLILTKFQVNWQFSSEEVKKIDVGFLIGRI